MDAINCSSSRARRGTGPASTSSAPSRWTRVSPRRTRTLPLATSWPRCAESCRCATRRRPFARAVARVMELEPLDPSPRFWLGAVALAHDYDWTAAEAHFRAALSASRASAEAHWVYASLYIGALGHFDASVAEMNKAIALDPLNPTWHAVLSAHLVNAGRPADALESAKKAVELVRPFLGAQVHHWRGVPGRGQARRGHQPLRARPPARPVARDDYRPARRSADAWRVTRTRVAALMEALGSSPRPVIKWVYHLHVGELRRGPRTGIK